MKLKTEYITLLRAILVTQMNHLSLFPIYVTFMTILHDIVNTGTPYVLLWLVLGCIPFLLYLGRQKLHKFWQFILLHLSTIGIMFLIPTGHIVIKVLYVTIGILYVVYSCYLHFKTKDRQDIKLSPFLTVAVFLVMLYILHHQEHSEWDTAFVTVLIVSLGLYFILYYIEQYLNFLKVNHSSAGHIPATEMFHSGMGLVLGYTGIGIVIWVLIAHMEWLRGILNVIKQGLFSFLRWLFSLLPQSGPTSMEGSTETAGIADMSEMAGMFQGGESSPLWAVVESAFGILFILALILILVKCLIFLIKFVRSKMKPISQSSQADSTEEIVDVREKCEITKDKERNLKFPFLPLSAKERIRHMYKKRLLASKAVFDAERKPEYCTARESSRLLQCEEAAYVYEKARYSNSDCDANDIKRMKNACK